MIDLVGILDKIQSHAAATGMFERVNTHEPKNAPGNGLTVAIWVDTISPVPAHSGLSVTTGRVAFAIRIYSAMLQEPQDMIDPNLVAAVDTLMGLYSGDFTLGDSVRNVDLLGQAGSPMSAQAGYLEQDRKLFRVMTINVPVIINDIWEQAE